MIALEKEDQLRQRMAWSLSQIVTVVEQNIDAYDLTEIYREFLACCRFNFGVPQRLSYLILTSPHLAYPFHLSFSISELLRHHGTTRLWQLPRYPQGSVLQSSDGGALDLLGVKKSWICL